MTTFKIGDNILDSRDVEERIDELEALETDLDDAFSEYDPDDDESCDALRDADDNFPTTEREELKTLRDFRSEFEGYCDWTSGEVLIEESYRQTYAEQLAEDIGAIDKNANWPLSHIDWEAATEELFRFDYHYADVDGSTYYVRMC